LRFHRDEKFKKTLEIMRLIDQAVSEREETEDRGQKTENRGQRTEDRGQKTESDF